MMVDYRAPGVYVREVPSGPRPITAVGTSTAAFLGVAPKLDAHLGEAVPIDNWAMFLSEFVGGAKTGTDLSSAVSGFFSNGGGRCYVVNLGTDGSLEGTSTQPGGLQLLEAIDEIAIVAAPGRCDVASYEALLGHCEAPSRQDRVAILDPPPGLGRSDIDRLIVVAQAPPPTQGALEEGESGSSPTSADLSPQGRGDRGGRSADRAVPADQGGLRPRQSDGGYGAFYFPWFKIHCLVSGNEISAPPSGHVAGIYARTDSTRGVHKAPANEPVVGALRLEYQVSQTEQEVLNPGGVNCIRFFPSEGIRLWGARTLGDPAGEWRYLNVRRLTIMLKKSIADGTRWMVFEPNSDQLWSEIRRDVGAFLTRVWQDGALVGTTPEAAFFVQCDEQTNPAPVRDAGQVVTVIGLAPVKPAEFVVFELMQSTLTGNAATVGG